ncbi:unnamed protein product [Didymodactylos carnosus]|uniref:NHL repeat-containing protein n=1 Tax=Didymodactylos carnosus TaxID=1234261 RepID=A0A815DQB7_9BILA|nr:unnamed protein product [Didymodactylos carnosus]CAF4135229.1 unnamed protein product [Didymodactylos carnosus]
MKWAVGQTKEVVVAADGPGSALNQLQGLEELFVDEHDTIYVADVENDRIQKWLKGSLAGQTVTGGDEKGSDLSSAKSGVLIEGGSKGNEITKFHGPKGVQFDADGNLYVADRNNHRVQKFTINNNYCANTAAIWYCSTAFVPWWKLVMAYRFRASAAGTKVLIVQLYKRLYIFEKQTIG